MEHPKREKICCAVPLYATDPEKKKSWNLKYLKVLTEASSHQVAL